MAVLLRRDTGAQTLANGEAVALVEFAAQRMNRSRARHERLPKSSVMCVTACCEDHALSCLDVDFFAGAPDRRAKHAPRLERNVGDWRVKQDFYAALSETVEEPRDQGIAHHQARTARVPGSVKDVTNKKLGRMAKIGRRFEAADQRTNVSLSHHHAAEQD